MEKNDSFFALTPEHVLDSVEKMGTRSTGRCYALNSLENRVYEVELEDNSKVVGKFYRPGRWTLEAILEEHEYLNDLAASEIPVAKPLTLANGSSVDLTDSGIFFSVFPKLQGRAPEELNDQQLIQLGRFLARIHNVGNTKPAPNRVVLSPQTYGEAPLKFLIDGGWLPMELQKRYVKTVEDILTIITPWFKGVKTHRIHGDCHLGNLLYSSEGPFFLDFDDMVTGPPVQDLWLLVAGRDEQALKDRETFLTGYTEMREFDHTSLRLIEPLRALRFIHYSAWIAKRWKDPAFPKTFPEFNTHNYWSSEIEDLEKQLREIQKVAVIQ